MNRFRKKLMTALFLECLQRFWDKNIKQISSVLVDSFENPSIKKRLFNPVTNTRWSILMEERCKRAAISTYDFIDREMPEVPYLFDKVHKWNDIKDTYINGYVLEFGVYQGYTVKQLANIFPEITIHGFDTFEGLPEDWNYIKKGTFNLNGQLPKIPENVLLYKGIFESSLPEWISKNQGNVAFINIDCDLYSSTKTVLSLLSERIVSGTVIHFDELIGYYGWQYQEYKAFQEFIKESGRKYEYISYGPTYVLLRIL